MALEVGARRGHYDVTALISEGGMGQVYQSTDTKLNRQVVLRILPEAFATDHGGLNMSNNDVGKNLLSAGRPLFAVVLVILIWNLTANCRLMSLSPGTPPPAGAGWCA